MKTLNPRHCVFFSKRGVKRGEGDAAIRVARECVFYRIRVLAV